jgi:hypothetical protein
MKYILTRVDFRNDGIFSELRDEFKEHLFICLEHSYSGIPKLPPGEYICKRGMHKLADLVPFETFEVMEVPGHYGILFHVGNYNEDSSGCILIGSGYGFKLDGGKMITKSRPAFKAFLESLKEIDEFTLNVE